MHLFTTVNPERVASLIPRDAESVTLRYSPASNNQPFSVVDCGGDAELVQGVARQPYSLTLPALPLIQALTSAADSVEVHAEKHALALISARGRVVVPEANHRPQPPIDRPIRRLLQESAKAHGEPLVMLDPDTDSLIVLGKARGWRVPLEAVIAELLGENEW